MGVAVVRRGCYLFVYNYVRHLAVDIALRFSGEAESLLNSVFYCFSCSPKQNKAWSACAESTNKGLK